VYFVRWVTREVVGVFVRFHAPLHCGSCVTLRTVTFVANRCERTLRRRGGRRRTPRPFSHTGNIAVIYQTVVTWKHSVR
jgi:hypothetical protein